jgi:radical SAM protein with 4Fe4S-binding SPASM domain
MMPRELYRKVIDELQAIQFSGRIAYHVNNEPLIFPDLDEFVTYARQHLPMAWIQILTNGKALTRSKAEQLLGASINELSINNYSDDFSEKLQRSIDDIRTQALPMFYNEDQIKTGHGPDKANPRVFRFNVFYRDATAVLTSRAGTAPNKAAKSSAPRGFCEYPFTQFNITTDGRVSKCCADFYFSDPMGNVKEENILAIWKGQKFQKTRQWLLQGDRDAMETCKHCDFYGVRHVYSTMAKQLYAYTQ